MVLKKDWIAPRLSVHGDMTKITLKTIAVKKHGTGDSLVANVLTPWQSCQCHR